MTESFDEVKIDQGVLVIAGIWHDYGKLWTYRPFDNIKWVDTDQKSFMARSYAEWISWNNQHPSVIPIDFIDAVGHCILSHHGCRDWGSTTGPLSREAWILHLADSCSARCMGGEKFK